MACLYPVPAWRTPAGDVLLYPPRGTILGRFAVPCGHCIDCRLQRSRDWALRIVHELQVPAAGVSRESCYLTLTIDDDALARSLDYGLFQAFMKRLRARYRVRMRFFACGEYGELNQRAHFHAIIFGFDFPDKRHWKVLRGNRLFTSEILEETWGHGFCTIGAVTFQSAAYVARYVVKKITGDGAEEHYGGREPEFAHMSLKPGIGSAWLARFGRSSVYGGTRGMAIAQGHRVKPPRYYDKWFCRLDPSTFEQIAASRRKAALQSDEQHAARRRAREAIRRAQLGILKRSLGEIE